MIMQRDGIGKMNDLYEFLVADLFVRLSPAILGGAFLS
jgi:hypothetical protein